MNYDMNDQAGVSSVAVLVALLIVVTLGLGGLSIWSYSNYRDQKDNVTAKVAAAVTQAKTDQSTADQASFAQAQKLPTLTFTGPSDYGSVTFAYPRTWSQYLGNGQDPDNEGTFTAYFNPGAVPTVSSSQQFALRVSIQSQDYPTVLAQYTSQVKSGTLTSAVVTTNGLTGTRLSGKFNQTIDGEAVIFKVRDKTLIAQTDSPTYRPDFDNTILPSLSFTP